jgi:4-amino-4-deoxy-L-arabinose transferase-like glycosyltransferase
MSSPEMSLPKMSWRSRGLKELDGFVDALCDPARQHRAVIGFILAYAAIWTLYAVIAKSTQGINVDMAEMVVWSRVPALGYPRHPPLLAWLVTAWFAIFPLADWAYHLLAVTVVSAGLYVGFILAGEWLAAEKRALVPFFLALIPFYNFLGLKFDQNSALIPLWGLATWGFVRSLDTRHAGWAALAGLATAAAVLTKYWSVFLIAGFAIAALLDRRRAAYFKSPAPWVSIAVGALAIAPHGWWLVANDFPPFMHATDRRSQSVLEFFDATLREYLGGTFAYAIVPIALSAMLARPSFADIKALIPPRADHRRAAWDLFWLPILIPIVAAALARVNLLSLWSAPAYALLPVVLFSPPTAHVTRPMVAWFVAAVAALSLGALAASPVIAALKLRNGVENYAAYARPLAAAIQSEWRLTSDRRLGILAGPFESVHTTAFYLRDKPVTWVPYGPSRFSDVSEFARYISPWVDAARIAREGLAMACPVTLTECVDHLNQIAAQGPPGRRTEVELTPRWLGLTGPAERFVIVTVPPRL